MHRGTPADDEIIVPLASATPARVTPLTAVRSTLLSASIVAITGRNLADQYFAQLPREFHVTMQTLVAGAWTPLEIALAHYAAADALGLSAAEEIAIGGAVGDRVQASVLSVIVRGAKVSGVTPWYGLAQYGRLWARIFQGGDCRVVKVGPKDARIENYGIPLVKYRYFRNAWRGMALSGIRLFCSKAVITEGRGSVTPTSFSLLASWV